MLGGEALSLLGKLGIDYAQGYYIGRPMKVPLMKSMPIPIATKHHHFLVHPFIDEILDKRPVDLDVVDGQLLYIAE